MKKRRKRPSLLQIAFGAAFLLSACMVGTLTVQAHREQQAFLRLEESVAAAQEAETQNPYAALQAENPDFFGWLSIEGTSIHYPVMHTPQEEDYYLHHDFAGNASQSGVPFLAGDCDADCGNYLIYGHNMNNGSMFAPLLSYAEADFGAAHPLIRFDTAAGEGTYRVLAAFYAEVYPQDATEGFRYYRYTDLRDAAVFAAYLSEVEATALYDTGVSAAYGDTLLTLSTCTNRSKTGRFVVVARKEAVADAENG